MYSWVFDSLLSPLLQACSSHPRKRLHFYQHGVANVKRPPASICYPHSHAARRKKHPGIKPL